MIRPIAVLLLAFTALHSVVAAEEPGEDSLQGVIERKISLRTHSLSAPYVDSDLQNRWWDFGADTVINTNKHVRLTQDKPSQTGWLWSRMPLSVSNWQMDVEFKVDGKAHNMFGDGFAVWVTKERAEVGPVFGNRDYFNGLGIFFDTYANSRHAYSWPRVTAMLGDGTASYDHDHDNAAHELAGCSEQFRRRDVPTKARLTYIKGRLLQLKLQTKKEDEWMVCFETDVKLPDGPYIGFTALTGDVSDNHDIVSISTYSATLTQEYKNSIKQSPMAADSIVSGRGGKASRKGRPASRDGKSSGAGWFLFILKIIGFLAFVAFGVAAYRTYTAQKKTSRPAYF